MLKRNRHGMVSGIYATSYVLPLFAIFIVIINAYQVFISLFVIRQSDFNTIVSSIDVDDLMIVLQLKRNVVDYACNFHTRLTTFSWSIRNISSSYWCNSDFNARSRRITRCSQPLL